MGDTRRLIAVTTSISPADRRWNVQACLDVLVARKRLRQAEDGKAMLVRMVSMLVGLIRSTSTSRVHEDGADYGKHSGESTDRD